MGRPPCREFLPPKHIRRQAMAVGCTRLSSCLPSACSHTQCTQVNDTTLHVPTTQTSGQRLHGTPDGKLTQPTYGSTPTLQTNTLLDTPFIDTVGFVKIDYEHVSVALDTRCRWAFAKTHHAAVVKPGRLQNIS